MKLLFLGSCIFGDSTNGKLQSPFDPLLEELRSADVIFLNIEGVITSRTEKFFSHGIKSEGEQLLSLKKLIPYTPILIEYRNEWMVGYGSEAAQDTVKFLKENGFIFNPGLMHPLRYGMICMFSFISSDFIWNSKINDKILPINFNNAETLQLLTDIIRSYRRPFRKIIVNIRWGLAWRSPPIMIEKFAEALIDNGAEVVFGGGSHNLPLAPCRNYKRGLIIFGLGELANYKLIGSRHYEITSESCMFNSVTKDFYTRLISKTHKNGCLIPRKIENTFPPQ